MRRGLAIALAALAWIAGPVLAAVPKPGQEPLPEAAPTPLPPPATVGAEAPPPLPPEPRRHARPVTSPGTWVQTEDYPVAAAHYEMEGVTAFRLYVDARGAVSQCVVTGESGYELLDRAACTLMRERASFTPATDARGRPVPDVYTNRIVWRLPDADVQGGPARLAEGHSRFLLGIDRLGALTSCDGGGDLWFAQSGSCSSFFENMPSAATLAARGYGDAPVRQVHYDVRLLLGEERPPKGALDAAPGEVATGGLIWRFAVGESGRLASCGFAAQKGDPLLIFNLCDIMARGRYEVPVSGNGAPTPPVGWIIARFYYKAGP